jgi:NarL family two-component system response regulator LiaR
MHERDILREHVLSHHPGGEEYPAGGADGSGLIRVMLVDDHLVVRSGLRAFLSVFDEFEFVGEAGNGREALQLCPSCKPDVVLMDLLMPEMNGAEATREIRRLCPHVQVVVLTSFREETLVEEALKAGAIGYLLKDVTADELADAIRAAVKGKPTLSPEATQALIHASMKTTSSVPDLTDREMEVLRLMVSGDSNPEIAKRLVVSLSTVKFHVSSILSKLDVGSRTEAVSLALREQLL